MMTFKTIIEQWLREHGYDGLVNLEIGEPYCGCLLDDLFLCGECPTDCQPGYRGPPTPEGGTWAIYLTKEAAAAAKENP